MAKKKPTRSRSRSQARKNPFLSKSLRSELQKDAAAKLRALQTYGIAKRSRITPSRLTDKRIAEINKEFKRANQHGSFVNGKVERMFRATKKGYVLSDHFTFTPRKIKGRGSVGAVHTQTGTILQTLNRDSHIIAVDEKTGRITYREKLEGKFYTIHSSPATPDWIFDFIKRVKNGKYKFPKGYAIRLTFFDFADKQSQLIYSTAELKRVLTHRRKKHPSYEVNVVNALKTGHFKMGRNMLSLKKAGIEPIKLEFIELKSGSKTP